MLQGYRSKREDGGRGSLKLVFGGGEKGIEEVISFRGDGDKNMDVWRGDSLPIA